MSKEGSINVYRQLIEIHEERLKGMKRRKALLDKAIPDVERELKQEKKKLFELEHSEPEGGTL